MTTQRQHDATVVELLTIAEIARLAKLHPKTVAREIRAGRIRRTIVPGAARRVLVSPEDYEAWRQGCRLGSREDDRSERAVVKPRPHGADRPRQPAAVTEDGRLVLMEGMGR